MSSMTKVSAAFRFSDDVIAELDRKREELGGITRTEFLTRCIMDGTAPASIAERLDSLEQRIGELENSVRPSLFQDKP